MILARSVLASYFIIAGVISVVNFQSFVQEIVNTSLPAPRLVAVAVIFIKLGGSILLISNAGGMGWFGAVILACFTLLCIPLAHPFWCLEEPKRTTSMQFALEHCALSGGLVVTAITLIS
ncbi:DoxX family protein [Pseudomonas sp. SDO524_S393]